MRVALSTRMHPKNAVVLGLAASIAGCRAVGTVFRAGAWMGALAVVVILAIIGGTLSVLRHRGH